MAVLSNSGKRSAPNAKRIADMGFPQDLFEFVMTSGEALWLDVANGAIPQKVFWPIERAAGDARSWAEGLEITLVDALSDAEAILLMGLPDGSELADWTDILTHARNAGLPIYCSNPDKASPRDGGLVISPGALAFAHQELGGEVHFYGKPHRPVFTSLEQVMGSKKLLMVGDSAEHDIAGGQQAGWDTLLIQAGLYNEQFASGDLQEVLDQIIAEKGCDLPTYTIETVR